LDVTTRLGLLTLVSLATMVVVPAIVVSFLLHWLAPKLKIPRWTALASFPLVVVLSAAFTFTWIFPDVGRGFQQDASRVTVEIQVPTGYSGLLYVFFDSQLPPLQPIADKRYRVVVPPEGKVIVGRFPGDTATYEVRSSQGARPPVVPESLTSGSQSQGGAEVTYVRPFIGSESDFKALRQSSNNWFDELDVYQKLKKQGLRR